MTDKHPAEGYGKNEAKTHQGEACDNGANEGVPMTEHIVIDPNSTNGYQSLPPTEERPRH